MPPPMAPRARPGGCQDYPSRGAPRGGRHGGARGGAAPRRPGPLGLRGARLQGTGVTRRDVSRGDVRRSDVTVPRGGRERGTVAVPGTGGHPCGGGGERCRPECSRGVAGPLLPPAGSGRVGSGRGEAARPPGSRLPPAQTGRAPVLRSRPTAGGTASPAAGGCLQLLRAPLRLAPPAQLRDEATRLRTAAGPETTPPPPPPLSRGAAGTPAAGAANGAAVASGEWGAPLCSPGPGRGSSGAWQRS